MQVDGRPGSRLPPEGCAERSLVEASTATPRPRRASLPALTERAADQLPQRRAKMYVDDAVEEEVEREVHRQEDVRRDDGRAEKLRRFAAYDVVEELYQLGGRDQHEIHADEEIYADDGHEGGCHAASARRGDTSANRIQSAQAVGLSQRPNHVHVAVD